MIVCPSTSSKGTAFALKNGVIVTNEHVVRDCQPEEIQAISSFGDTLEISQMVSDVNRDLAILIPEQDLEEGLGLRLASALNVGTVVSTWGYPLGYNGPAPLLSVGYLAGYRDHRVDELLVRRLVVNGAFNPGNSGGPLFESNNEGVVGVVVSKHAPLTQFQKSALEALASNRSGLQYSASDDQGNRINFAESQLVADLLLQLRKLSQVMIGEAISVDELRSFLEENGFDTPQV
jgi:S1-C subfamily serine protease